MIRACRLVARGDLENGTRCRRWAQHVDVVALLVAVALVVPTVDAGPPASSGRSKSRASTSAEKGQMLRGTVVKAADGSPVVEATVYLATGRTFNRAKEARTDAAGRFAFGPGRCREIFALCPVRQPDLASAAARVRASHRQGREAPPPVTLRLAEGCRFRITVKRASDGRPIAGAKIDFRWPDIKRQYPDRC